MHACCSQYSLGREPHACCDTALNQVAGCCGRPPLSPFQPILMIQHHAACCHPLNLLTVAGVTQVALGRLALEPLAVLAALCRPDSKEILSLNLHPMQTHVPESDLLKAAERSVMTVIAQVSGVLPLLSLNSFILECCWSFVLSIGASSCSRQEQKQNCWTSGLMLSYRSKAVPG